MEGEALRASGKRNVRIGFGSGLGTMERTLTSLKCPAKIRTALTLSVIHNRAVLSRLAVAKYTPLGPHSTAQTGSRCPRYTTRFVKVSSDQRRTVQSAEAERR